MEIIFKEENGKLFGSTNTIGIGKRQPKLIYGEQAKKLRDNLLKYCKLDTYAMVKIYDELKTLIKEK